MKNQNTNIKAVFAVVLLFAAATTQAQTWNTSGNAGTNPATNFIGTTDSKHLRIRTNNQVRMTVDSAGRVGIGTQTPGYLFEVKNTATTYAAKITNELATGSNIETQYVSSRNIGTGGAVASRFEAMGGGGGSNSGVISYVQDGTTNYGINSSAGTLAGQSGYGVYASVYGGGNNYGIYASASGGFTNYAAYLNGKTYISDRLLIGTTSATAKLNLQNTDTALTTFKVYANGANRLLVDGKGRVMIGTATPANGYALSVKGKVMCEELKVELNASWPDYVFANDYKLKTIDEVEEHINQFKHLPGMPAAAEMEANGISVGEMQTKLVEKVEELTLYIIQLKKEVETLKQR